MFKDIAQWTRIRRRVLRGSISQRRMALESGISRQTVRKMLKFTLPPGCRRQQPSRRSQLGPWIGVIDQIVKEDGTLPKKQRNTAKQIWRRLCEEQQFSGGYTTVKDYLRRARFIATPTQKQVANHRAKSWGNLQSNRKIQLRSHTRFSSLFPRERRSKCFAFCASEQSHSWLDKLSND